MSANHLHNFKYQDSPRKMKMFKSAEDFKNAIMTADSLDEMRVIKLAFDEWRESAPEEEKEKLLKSGFSEILYMCCS